MSVSSINISVDLRTKFGKIRDQGPRPTCMAFAASDCHSFALGNNEPLSAEYAFYYAVERTAAKDLTRGVPFSAMAQAISLDGQPAEESWPYQSNLTPADSWTPPDDPGQLYYRDSEELATGFSVIRGALEQGEPVMAIMDVSRSFFVLGANDILEAPNDESRLGTHAVLMIGHGYLNGDICFLLRNSWGERWAAMGHGWVYESYLKPRLRLAAILK